MSDWPQRIFREKLVDQAARLGIAPRDGESPGGWQDRTRCAAIMAETTHIVEPSSEPSWTGDPHKLSAELRRVAGVFDPEKGFRLPQLLRDAADEIDCLSTHGDPA